MILGLDCAGKTTILYKLDLGKTIDKIPTIGFSVETKEYKHIKFTVLDLGGQDKLRPMWRYYYKQAAGFIFVVDSNDRDRMGGPHQDLDNNGRETVRMVLTDV